MNNIVKFNDERGQLVQFSADDIKARICPNITDSELALVMGLCQAQNLNPFTRDVYIIKYGTAPASIVTGKEVFTKRANQQKTYQGFEAGVTFINAKGEVCQRQGSAIYKAAHEVLIGGWCRVFVEGRKPFYDEVTLDEYQLTDKDGKPKSGWAKMPATMIRKVALVHCLREAFPNDFQGLYCSEEMGKAGEQAAQLEEEPAPTQAPTVAPAEVVAVQFEEIATQEQVEELQSVLWQLADLCGKTDEEMQAALLGTRALQEAGVEALIDMNKAQADVALKMAHTWLEKQLAKQPQQEQQEQGTSQLEASICGVNVAIENEQPPF